MTKMKYNKAQQHERIKKYGFESPFSSQIHGIGISSLPPHTSAAPVAEAQQFSSLSELWKSITDREKVRRGYIQQERYFPFEIISHSSFGDGVVFEVTLTNISILFQSGIKKLVHRRQEQI